MPKNLLIVESPAKAKTIEKYLGKDFTVKSSYGHVRDLEKSNNAVDVKNEFEPNYVVSPDKTKVVSELKKLVKKVDEVWLATDEDREGEAISWHLCQVLGLDPEHTKRIVFREITKPAIQRAITKPRTVDINLVDAQQARRILDRLVGYELSGILWKKIRGKLSAGRVQSVAVKLVVEREKEIMDFEVQSFYRVYAEFKVRNEQGNWAILKAELPERMAKLEEAEAFLNKCLDATYTIQDIQVKPLKRKPTAPFTTSTLQQEASRKLGFSVKRTMNVAQSLYESGFITYMRTDSVALSELALQSIEETVQKEYGPEYHKLRRFKNKASGAQEAHEAIRPTYFQRKSVSGNRDEQRLYELIWKRAVASQMAEAQLEKTTVKIGISTTPDRFLKAEGEVLKFDGFLKVYLESRDDDEEEEAKGMLPPLKVGQELLLKDMTGLERFTRPPARYTEASLVKKMEELGIGRPSTYAPTISKIMEPARGYVVKESREGTSRSYHILKLADGKIERKEGEEKTGAVKNRLFPTDIGIVVVDFLDNYFDDIMDYSFTAEIEEIFDDIAEGKKEWRTVLNDFYWPFHETVEETIAKAERPTNERILGEDPETGRTVLTRMTKNGPVVQIGAPDELIPDEKPRYANLRQGQSIHTITFEEAMELFQFPKVIGEYEGEEVSIGVGRYGPYVKYGDRKFVSIPKGEDPLSVSMERARELIRIKEKENAPVGTYKDKPITKGKGRFGPYLKWNGMYVNVPKRYDFDNLSQEEMDELIQKKEEKEANRYIQVWDEEKISLENGRWGPFIRFKRKNVKLPKVDGKRMTSEQAAELDLDQVKAIIEEEIPNAFPKQKTKKKTSAKSKKK